MVNYQQQYIKYKKLYLNLKNYKNQYGGAPKFVMNNGKQIDINYDATTTIEDVKRKIVQQLDLPYWFLIDIIHDTDIIFDNNIRLVDILDQAVPRQGQEINTIFTINISRYNLDDAELLNMILIHNSGKVRYILRDKLRRTHDLSNSILSNKNVLLLIIDILKDIDYLDFTHEIFDRIPEEHKNDNSFMLAAIRIHGRVLKYASNELRTDKEIVLAVVKQNINRLLYASEELKGDRDFILDLVRQNGLALHYASEELRNDYEIALIAYQNNREALNRSSYEVRNYVANKMFNKNSCQIM
jgi:hypothetical protein